MKEMSQLIDVSHVSKRGGSLRITIPSKVAKEFGIKPEDGNRLILSELK